MISSDPIDVFLYISMVKVQGQNSNGKTVKQTAKNSWPAMRVISLGIRTVPVLSVAKKLAAPRPTPTAPAAKCGLMKQDEAD